jgi:hypothetical protein
VHWTYDTYALAETAGKAMIQQGGDSWFFITADYAFGHALERDTAAIVKANGGTVVGAVRHPQDTADLSSFLFQAQTSKAKVIGLANAGGDTINSIKQANEFGIIRGGQKMIGLLTYISDVHGMGLQYAKGLILASAFYWDLTDETRAWTRRFMERSKKIPTMANAGAYGATLHYLKAIKEAGTDEAQAVVRKMKEIPVNDFFTKGGSVREDGRVIRSMYLFRNRRKSRNVPTTTTSFSYGTGQQAFRPLAEGGFPLLPKKLTFAADGHHGKKRRLGFLIPPGNPTVEPEMIAMAPKGVPVHFSRMVARGPTDARLSATARRSRTSAKRRASRHGQVMLAATTCSTGRPRQAIGRTSARSMRDTGGDGFRQRGCRPRVARRDACRARHPLQRGDDAQGQGAPGGARPASGEPRPARQCDEYL